MNHASPFICVVPILILIGAAIFIWHLSRGKDILDNWAAQNGLQIISRERKTLLTGPYFFRKNKGQDVYFVTVQYPDGRQRSGYVRVGGAFLGMMSDAIDVTWDD